MRMHLDPAVLAILPSLAPFLAMVDEHADVIGVAFTEWLPGGTLLVHLPTDPTDTIRIEPLRVVPNG